VKASKGLNGAPSGRQPRAVVVGSGAGGAAAARELQGSYQVTILEAGREFRPLSLSMPRMQRLRDWGLLFDERLIRLAFPSMVVRRGRDGMIMVNGAATGGTTLLSTGSALRMDGPLREIGIDLDREFGELARDVPVSIAHQASWSPLTWRLFQVSRDMGLAPEPTPKFVDSGRCRRCGRCVLGCPHGAKWDSRRFLDDARIKGARLLTGCRVTKVVIRGGRAVGVRARAVGRTVFLPADLVVLAAGGLGTPVILERSGIRCEPRLFADPVLCVAAPWTQSMQHAELPMPFLIQRPGYMISPYFDYLSFLFDRRWRRPAGGILALMIKLADSECGSVPARGSGLDKGLTAEDRRRLEEAEALCRQILVRFGADPASIFLGTLNAGHPGGMLPLTAAEAETLRPGRLPPNLYVADATLFPRSLGNPPILTILALARRVARAAVEALGLPPQGVHERLTAAALPPAGRPGRADPQDRRLRRRSLRLPKLLLPGFRAHEDLSRWARLPFPPPALLREGVYQHRVPGHLRRRQDRQLLRLRGKRTGLQHREGQLPGDPGTPDGKGETRDRQDACRAEQAILRQTSGLVPPGAQPVQAHDLQAVADKHRARARRRRP
jgi:ferredoxin